MKVFSPFLQKVVSGTHKYIKMRSASVLSRLSAIQKKAQYLLEHAAKEKTPVNLEEVMKTLNETPWKFLHSVSPSELRKVTDSYIGSWQRSESRYLLSLLTVRNGVQEECQITPCAASLLLARAHLFRLGEKKVAHHIILNKAGNSYRNLWWRLATEHEETLVDIQVWKTPASCCCC